MSTLGVSAVERPEGTRAFGQAQRSPLRASARTLVVSREARAERELPDGLENANTATSSDPPAIGQGPDAFRPLRSDDPPPLGPSLLVNQSSDDVDAGTANIALLKPDNPGHPGHPLRALGPRESPMAGPTRTRA
jgi:hypothetical protein